MFARPEPKITRTAGGLDFTALDLPENIFPLTSAFRPSKVRAYDERTKKYFFDCTAKLVVAQL